MIDGTEKCKGCRRSPWPQGYEPNQQKCWSCAFPRNPLPLTEAQREFIKIAWQA